MRYLLFLSLFILASTLFAESENSDVSPYRVSSKAEHEMQVINSGQASLYARVDMIRRAKKSIDLETFIFNDDTAGKIILKELADAAKRGVKVRLLVDKSPTQSKLHQHYAKAIKEQGIDIRYYNTSPVVALSSVQYRNHRKLMVRDGEEAITGGRNIADEYFDLSHEFNFLDRDITVKGEIVKSMDQTFDNFWNSKMAEEPSEPVKPRPIGGRHKDNTYHARKNRYKRQKKEAEVLFDSTPEITAAMQRLMVVGNQQLGETQKHKCPEVAFASDREGASFTESLNNEKYSRKYRLLRQEIAKWMDEKIEGDVYIDTPYFLQSSITEKLLKKIQSGKAKVKLFTNSLASTDAIHVSTVFGDEVTNYTPYDNFEAFVYKGNYSNERKMDKKDVEDAAWGTHSKSMVFSDNAFMIGSFNMDNRSSYYNTELAIFCSGSPELTQDVKKNIEKRVENSIKLDKDGNQEDCGENDIHPEAGVVKKTLYYLIKIPSHLLQHLL